MVVLSPGVVTFGQARWAGVRSVVIDRTPERAVIEGSDVGPHATFADVPEVRVRVKVVMDLAADALDAPRPGQLATLTFFAAPGAADAARVRVRATCVVLRVTHEVQAERATRTVDLVALSANGTDEPVTVDAAGGGA
jgi:hypothetical protein